TAYEMAGPRVAGAAETQRVEECDRPRPHRENVAHYAADPGCRPLIGLDEGRMVVALDLEDDGVAVADIDDAGIFSRAANHPRPLGRQCLEPNLRRFIGAVLAPHH